MSASGDQIINEQNTPSPTLEASELIGSARILIVEDEEKISSAIMTAVTSAGFQAEVCDNGDAGFRTALKDTFHLLILDVNLPGKNGFDILAELRKTGSKVPVLMLTSRDAIDDRMKGFNAGADDYLSKPFYVEELVARVAALIRRSAKKSITESTNITSDAVVVGKVSLSRLKREVKVGKKVIEMTLREFDLLEYLMRSPDKVRPRIKIMKSIWNYGSERRNHILEVYIARLRTKLDDAGVPNYIETVRGVGYRINSEYIDDSDSNQ